MDGSLTRPAALSASTHARPRLYGLDALRGTAALLVVLLHAAIPYLRIDLPGLVWPVRDPSFDPVVNGLFWWIEGFIMPLFFLIAGYFSTGPLRKLGPAPFLRQRAKRLLLPLAVVGTVVLTLDVYVWALGLVASGRYPARKLLSLKFDGIEQDFWGLGHLWFLQYLFLLSALLCVAAVAWRRLSATGAARHFREAIDAVLLSPWRPLALAIPTALLLWLHPEVVTGFQHSFWPVLPKLLHSALFFFVGCRLACRQDLRDSLSRAPAAPLALSCLAFALLLPLIHEHLAEELSGARRAALAISMGLFAWLTVFGVIGLFLRGCRRERPAVAALANASFWIYLVHHPLVALAQIALAPLALPAWQKFAAASLIAVGLSLMSYYAVVRTTWIGGLLDSRRVPALSIAPRAEAVPTVGAAVQGAAVTTRPDASRPARAA